MPTPKPQSSPCPPGSSKQAGAGGLARRAHDAVPLPLPSLPGRQAVRLVGLQGLQEGRQVGHQQLPHNPLAQGSQPHNRPWQPQAGTMQWAH